MYRLFVAFLLVSISCGVLNAAVLDVENALRTVYNNCVGIDNSLHDMKVKAGIGTAVTGVGTGIGIGAVAVGVAKAKTDSLIEEKFKLLESLSYGASGDIETMDKEEWLKSFQETDVKENDKVDDKSGKEQIRVLTEKSKKLGDWRTGLLVGNTVTNIAGAVMSGTNMVDANLSEQIQNCKSALQNLRRVAAQARIDGIDVGEAVNIQSACNGFEYVDAESIAKINSLAKGGTVSSAVGTGTGVVGIITSALANSDKIREDDSNQGKQKEKNLNTAANVFAVGSTIASATATVFNASQIKAIKDVSAIAEKCAEALR